jgi:hypothetical protein
LKYVSNNNIAKFYKDDILIFEIIYDEKFIYVNQSTKIPITNDKWAHIVIMRGKTDTIGSDRGSIYINGIFFAYIDILPNLQSMNNAYLFKNSNAPNEYNKNYHDLSNCSLVRMYDRSLTVDEIQNNYLKDAAHFGLLDEQTEAYRTYVNDKSLIFYLECRITTPPILDKTVDSSIRSIDVVEEIQVLPHLRKIKKSEPLYRIDDSKANVISIYSDDVIPNKPLEIIHNISKPEQKTDQIIIIDSSDSEDSSNNWLQKAKKEQKKEQKKEKKQIKIQEEAVKLQNNWLDGAPKPNNSNDKKEDKKDDKDKKKDDKEQKKEDKDKKKDDKKEDKDKKKDVKEIKTSKPIF